MTALKHTSNGEDVGLHVNGNYGKNVWVIPSKALVVTPAWKQREMVKVRSSQPWSWRLYYEFPGTLLSDITDDSFRVCPISKLKILDDKAVYSLAWAPLHHIKFLKIKHTEEMTAFGSSAKSHLHGQVWYFIKKEYFLRLKIIQQESVKRTNYANKPCCR